MLVPLNFLKRNSSLCKQLLHQITRLLLAKNIHRPKHWVHLKVPYFSIQFLSTGLHRSPASLISISLFKALDQSPPQPHIQQLHQDKEGFGSCNVWSGSAQERPKTAQGCLVSMGSWNTQPGFRAWWHFCGQEIISRQLGNAKRCTYFSANRHNISSYLGCNKEQEKHLVGKRNVKVSLRKTRQVVL